MFEMAQGTRAAAVQSRAIADFTFAVRCNEYELYQSKRLSTLSI